MNKIFFSRLKTGAVMFTMAGAMAFSGVAGAASISKAEESAATNVNYAGISTQELDTDPIPNTKDREFTHNNSVSVNYTKFRRKYNETKVYIHPTSGPKLYYRVQGADNANGAGTEDRSNAHGVPVGVYASFTNYVKENDNPYARLKMRRSMTGEVDSKGVWSPDSTRNYTIYD